MGSVAKRANPKAQVSRIASSLLHGTEILAALFLAPAARPASLGACGLGARYNNNHSASHTKPSAPVRKKAHLHPQRNAMKGTASGARTAPIFEPELNNPVARARSRWGNHSATVLTAAGKLLASPPPSAQRATPNPKAELSSPCAAAATLH